MMDLWTALVLGLVGSLHCAGMCGPLALALPAAGRSTAAFVAGRVGYNAGRILTYFLLGLGFGTAGKSLLMAGVQRWLSIGLGALLIAGLLASRRLVFWTPVLTGVHWLKARMGALLREPSLIGLATLGVLNGLLPCGLVYVAAAGAMATGGIMQGGVYMIVFGLGTVPMMLGLSCSGRMLPARLRLKLRTALPVAVFLVGALLILRGMNLGIPYLSPVLGAEGVACCHE